MPGGAPGDHHLQLGTETVPGLINLTYSLVPAIFPVISANDKPVPPPLNP
jgi:hypothetical protein